jgi:hypothetical protein
MSKPVNRYTFRRATNVINASAWPPCESMRDWQEEKPGFPHFWAGSVNRYADSK